MLMPAVGGGCGDGDQHDEIDDNATEIEPEMGAVVMYGHYKQYFRAIV